MEHDESELVRIAEAVEVIKRWVVLWGFLGLFSLAIGIALAITALILAAQP